MESLFFREILIVSITIEKNIAEYKYPLGILNWKPSATKMIPINIINPNPITLILGYS